MAQRFEDIISAVQVAAHSAQTMVEKQHLSILRRYFTKRDDGVYVPKTVKMALPSMTPGVDSEVHEFPLACLVDLTAIRLGELEVKLEVELDSLAPEDDYYEDLPEGIDIHVAPTEKRSLLASLKRGRFSGSTSSAEVRVIFKGDDVTGGTARLSDILLKRME